MSDIKQAIKRSNELYKELEDLKRDYAHKIPGFLHDELKQAMLVAPEITSVTWTQGTPSFNDGEPCEFSVGEVEFSTNYEDDSAYLYTQKDLDRAKAAYESVVEYERDPESWKRRFIMEYESKYKRPYFHRNPSPYPSSVVQAKAEVERIENFFEVHSIEDVTRIQTAFDTWHNTFTSISEDFMRFAFGDGVRVTITESGADTDEYYD